MLSQLSYAPHMVERGRTRTSTLRVIDDKPATAAHIGFALLSPTSKSVQSSCGSRTRLARCRASDQCDNRSQSARGGEECVGFEPTAPGGLCGL